MLFYCLKPINQNSTITPAQQNIINATRCMVSNALMYQSWLNVSKAHFKKQCEINGISISEAERYIGMVKAWGQNIHNFLSLGINKLLQLSTSKKKLEREEIINTAIKAAFDAEEVLRAKRAERKGLPREDKCELKRIGGRPILRVELNLERTAERFIDAWDKSKNSINRFMEHLLDLHEQDCDARNADYRWTEEFLDDECA